MKLFWSIIAFFAIAALVLVWAQLSDRQGGVELASGSVGPQGEYVDAPALSHQRIPRDSPSEAVAERAADFPATDDDVEVPPEPPMVVTRKGGREVVVTRSDDEHDGTEKKDRAELEKELVEDLLTERESSAGPTGSPGEHEHIDDLSQAENPWKDRDEPRTLEHSIVERGDGTIVLDGIFEIKGKGTSSDPYQITWDLLMSAAETYQPRVGMNDIPERIQMLDGKYVRISGHLLFPMASFQTDEVLVMLNMWDGCCLGLMPSPYDAIEVQLTEAVDASGRQFMNYGTLEGRLNVDPYLINNWLIGLYVLEDGKLQMGM